MTKLLRLLTIAGMFAGLVAAAAVHAEDGDKNLTVGSWPGAYSDAQQIALLKPFEEKTGIQVTQAFHDGELSTMLAKLDQWDVADLSEAALTELCDEGKLLKLDAKKLAESPDGAKAADDFVEGGLKPCGVAGVIWSSVIVFDAGHFEGSAPRDISHLLQTKRFPGKRALPEGPQYLMEIALLADGVRPSDVYEALETEEGVSRALAALNRIRDDIVWWKGAREPLRMLADGEVEMALAFNGRAFTAAVVENQPIGLLWDGAIYDLDYWAVRKDSPNKDEALRLIEFVTRTEQMAEQARWFPYAPARRSASKLVASHAEVDVDMRDFAPIAGPRLERGLRRDAMWWAEHEKRIKARLDAWRDGDENPVADKQPDPDTDEKKSATKSGADEGQPEKRAEDKESESEQAAEEKSEPAKEAAADKEREGSREAAGKSEPDSKTRRNAEADDSAADRQSQGAKPGAKDKERDQEAAASEKKAKAAATAEDQKEDDKAEKSAPDKDGNDASKETDDASKPAKDDDEADVKDAEASADTKKQKATRKNDAAERGPSKKEEDAGKANNEGEGESEKGEGETADTSDDHAEKDERPKRPKEEAAAKPKQGSDCHRAIVSGGTVPRHCWGR